MTGAAYGLPIRLDRTGDRGPSAAQPGDPGWDIWINDQPFLLANSPERPYARETVPIRRDRVDQARDPGEASLDSNLWLRSQTSWHMGAGQEQAEPLESEQAIARFRFHDSTGVDIWTPGQMGRLPSMDSRSEAVVRHCVGSSVGVVAACTDGVRLYHDSGSSSLSSKNYIARVVANDTYWYGVSNGLIDYGLLAGGGEGFVTLMPTPNPVLAWAKDRLWLGVGTRLHEITSVAPTTIPAAIHEFRSGKIVDIDQGSAGIYVMVHGDLTNIYVITAQDNGSLNAPREVAVLPRGERGVFLYGYLGKYLVIGTDKGVRVADCSDSTNLPIGPLTITDSSGIYDAVGMGPYVWVSGSASPVAGRRAGTYRIDLSAPVDGTPNSPGRFAYARDMWANGGSATDTAWAVTGYNGRLWIATGASVGTATLWRESATNKVTDAWVTSGRISYSTGEPKCWLTMGIEASGVGTVGLSADTGSGFYPVTQTEVQLPWRGDAEIDAVAHGPGSWLEWRLELYAGATDEVSVQGVTLRAAPVPRRARYHRIPLMCFDSEVDRNQVPVGYAGFAADRLRRLEDLEQSGGLVNVTDTRTGDVFRAQFERITFEGTMSPTRGNPNFGGVVTVMLTVF